MNTTADPYFRVNCPFGELGGEDVCMCVPGAVAGAYYCGVAGCFFGAVKSIWPGAAFGTVKAVNGTKILLTCKSQGIAGKIISPYVFDSICTGGKWAMTGIQEGAVAGGVIGFCSKHYQSITGKSFPDIEMELSLIPRVQLIERT